MKKAILGRMNFRLKTGLVTHRFVVITMTLVALTLMAETTTAAPVAETGLSRTVDGMTVYSGLVPSDIVSVYPPAHPESGMHGGKRAKRHSYHLLAALNEEKTGKRIDDAQFKASVTPFGLGSAEKKMEPMNIGNTVSNGNYFSLPVTGLYSITIYIKRSDSSSDASEARFEYKH